MNELAAGAMRREVFKLQDGRQIELSSLTLGDYAEASRMALKSYRRDQAQATMATIEALELDGAEREKYIESAILKAEKVSSPDLPKKTVEVPVRVGGGGYLERDGEIVTRKEPADYAIWWMAETVEGRLVACWLSMRRCPGQEAITLDEVDRMFTNELAMLDQAANVVGDLSQSEILGKSPAPSNAPAKEQRQARRRKRGRRSTGS
jgi:hypothetical protein